MFRTMTIIALVATHCTGCSPSKADGLWVVASINGRSVAGTSMKLEIEGGKIVGGHDGCNGWARDPDNADMVVTDLMECPPDAQNDAYWHVVKGHFGGGLRLDGASFDMRYKGDVVSLRRMPAHAE